MLPPLPFQPVRWPLLAATLLPVVGALLAAIPFRHPRASRALILGTQSASLVALGVSLARLVTLPPLRRELVLGSWVIVDAGALHIEPSFVFDAVSGPLALAVAAGSLVLTLLLDDDAQSRGHRLARQVLPAAAVLALLADDAPTVVGMLEAMALAVWALARTSGLPVPPARSAVAARLGTWSFVVASLVLFWSLGATGWSQEGHVQRSTSLALVTGRLAAHDIVETRADSVPVGVEEAMAHGDRTASSAGWIVPGPSLSRRDIADAIRVPSTGVAARLSRHLLFGLAVPTLVMLLVLLAIAGVAMFVPFRGALSPPSALPPGVAPYLGWLGVAVALRLALGWRELATLDGGAETSFAVDVPGTYRVQARAEDGSGLSATQDVTVVANGCGLSSPEVTTIAATPVLPSIGATVSVVATVTDSDLLPPCSDQATTPAYGYAWTMRMLPAGSRASPRSPRRTPHARREPARRRPSETTAAWVSVAVAAAGTVEGDPDPHGDGRRRGNL